MRFSPQIESDAKAPGTARLTDPMVYFACMTAAAFCYFNEPDLGVHFDVKPPKINAHDEPGVTQVISNAPVSHGGEIVTFDPMPTLRAMEAEDDFLLAISSHVGSYWNIPRTDAEKIVTSVMAEAHFNRVDRFLVLGVIAKESSFRASARSHKGAKGLMQIIRKWHPKEFAGIGRHQKLSVTQNISIGVKVLKKYIHNNKGNVVAGLQGYNGASNDPDKRYANGVLANREHFLAAYHNFIGDRELNKQQLARSEDNKKGHTL